MPGKAIEWIYVWIVYNLRLIRENCLAKIIACVDAGDRNSDLYV